MSSISYKAHSVHTEVSVFVWRCLFRHCTTQCTLICKFVCQSSSLVCTIVIFSSLHCFKFKIHHVNIIRIMMIIITHKIICRKSTLAHAVYGVRHDLWYMIRVYHCSSTNVWNQNLFSNSSIMMMTKTTTATMMLSMIQCMATRFVFGSARPQTYKGISNAVDDNMNAIDGVKWSLCTPAHSLASFRKCIEIR